MKADNCNSNDIYNACIKKLIKDRLIKTRKDNNILIFEQYGSKPSIWLKNVKNVISETVNEINESFSIKVNYEVNIHDKSDVNLSIIDYINFMFVQFFDHKKVEPRMSQNFNIIEPKIGLVYKMDKDLFYDKNKTINIKEY